jgi:hypothetical protein
MTMCIQQGVLFEVPHKNLFKLQNYPIYSLYSVFIHLIFLHCQINLNVKNILHGDNKDLLLLRKIHFGVHQPN